MNYLEIVQDLADEMFEGHFTIMKFTTNYRGCYYTIDNREDISHLEGFGTLDELLIDMIKIGLDAKINSTR